MNAVNTTLKLQTWLLIFNYPVLETISLRILTASSLLMFSKFTSFTWRADKRNKINVIAWTDIPLFCFMTSIKILHLPSKFQQMQNNAKCIDAASFQPTNLFSRRVFNSGRSRSGAHIKERREEGKGEAHSRPQTDVKKKSPRFSIGHKIHRWK